ncbi:hypothetical protein IB270_07540 [Ensifer sp. ENS05]|nr:hypothetical protein [Ensifer sp. ENS05]
MLARQIMGQQPKTAAEGIGALLSGIGVGVSRYRTDKAQQAGTDAASKLYNSILGTPARSTASAPSVTPGAMGGNMPKVDSKGDMPIATVGNDEIRNGIISSASALGIDPVDLATAISYETAGTFDPTKRGPKTQWGQHQGFIQFGEPQAKEHGVDWNNPVGSQLGENGAVVSYLRKAGVKPGMGMMDIYSAINAGGVGRYGASDANNGGAPGTVADKVNNQMAGHRQKALALLRQGGANVDEPLAYYDDQGMSVESRQPVFSPDAQTRPAGDARSTVDARAPQNAAEAVTAMAGGNMPATSPFVSPFVDPRMQSAAAANQAGASLSDEVAAFEQTPEYKARFPGRSPSFPGKQADDMAVAALPQPVNVGANPVPPNSQLIASSQIPAEFAGSQQLASAEGGIMNALNGGTPATPQQIAQAQAAGQQPAQVAQSAGGVDPRLYGLLTNDFATPEMKAYAQMMIEQQMLANDPKRQLEMRKLQRELDAPRKRETSVVNGRLVDNQTGQVIAEYPDAQKPTADRQNYEYYREFETKNGRTPLGPLEWEQAQRKAGANSTTNIVGGEGDKFYQKLDEKNAEALAALSDAGMQARARMGQINRLEGLFANVPQGIEGGFKKLAGDWGVAIGEGTSDIQAASALLEKMVPEQRAPGSGPMSDADIRMFRASLPRVLNQPGGNELIFQTMRGIAEYEQQMGAIADDVADRAITPAEGRRKIRELKNPLDNYKLPDGPTPNEGNKTRTGVKWGYEE